MQTSDITERRLRRLAETDVTRGHVISAVLNLDPAEFAVAQARSSAVRSLLDETRARIDELEDLTHEEFQWLREDFARLESYLTGDLDPSGAHAVAVFCGSASGLFEVWRLPEPVPSTVTIGRRPHLEPIAGLAQSERWVVAVLARSAGRILVGSGQRLIEVADVDPDTHGQHKAGGWSQARYERSVDEEVARHVRDIRDRLLRRHERRPFDHLLVACGPELQSVVRGEFDGELEQRLAGFVDTDLQHASADDILEAVRPAIEAREREHEAERLQALEAGVAKGTLGVTGRDAVGDMLEQRRVETLLVPARVDDDEFIERAIEDALGQSAEVLYLRHHDETELPDGVAAVLRF